MKKKNVKSVKLEVITTMDNVMINGIYTITPENYHLIKPTIGNRGGQDDKRVNQFKLLIEKAMFDHEYNLITVDAYGNIGEGHHRVIALMLANKSFNIRVISERTLQEIANLNSGMRTQYSPKEVFNSAKTLGSKAVILLDDLRINLCKEFKLPLRKLTQPELYGILTKNVVHFSSGVNAPSIDMWMDKSLLALAHSEEFQTNVRLYAEMKYLTRNIRDNTKIAKAVMGLYFKNPEEFKLNVFVDALAYEGFILERYLAKPITEKAIAMHKKQLKNSKLVAA